MLSLLINQVRGADATVRPSLAVFLDQKETERLLIDAKRSANFGMIVKNRKGVRSQSDEMRPDPFLPSKPRLKQDHGWASSYGSPWCASPWNFQQHGDSGLWISELFPHLARHADKLCLLQGMHCDQPAHAQAFIQMHTGNFQSVRPSLGAWTLYGLGSESQNLPGFISINPPTATGGAQNYGSAFLPAAFQGTKFTIQDGSQRNRRIDQLRRGEANPYGINNAVNERLTRPQQRDQLDLINALNREKLSRDQHSPLVEGRDHNHKGYTMWMAGGGVKGGFSYGRTDEHGYEAIENKLHVHDWHATVLHLLGLNHERLTYRYAGREMRLTDVKGRVAEGISE